MSATKEEIEIVNDLDDKYISLHAENKHEASSRDSGSQPEDTKEMQEQLLWSRVRHDCREAFSEFFGTMILLLFGDGVVAQVVLSKGTKGDYQSISWGWG